MPMAALGIYIDSRKLLLLDGSCHWHVIEPERVFSDNRRMVTPKPASNPISNVLSLATSNPGTRSHNTTTGPPVLRWTATVEQAYDVPHRRIVTPQSSRPTASPDPDRNPTTSKHDCRP